MALDSLSQKANWGRSITSNLAESLCILSANHTRVSYVACLVLILQKDWGWCNPLSGSAWWLLQLAVLRRLRHGI